MAEHTYKPRQCLYLPDGQRDEHGHIPSLVTEDQPGHQRLPWHWGRDLDEAQGRCNAENTKLGLSEHDVAEIVASSMSRRIGTVPVMAGARHVVTVTRRSPGRRNWHIECSCGRWWDAIHSFGWTRAPYLGTVQMGELVWHFFDGGEGL